jgi:hypothetical protein
MPDLKWHPAAATAYTENYSTALLYLTNGHYITAFYHPGRAEWVTTTLDNEWHTVPPERIVRFAYFNLTHAPGEYA